MKKVLKTMLFIQILFASFLSSNEFIPKIFQPGNTVVPNDKEYYKHNQNNTQILYTKENLPFAKHTANIENSLNRQYELFFNWKLDETLYIGLMSDCNQIANGFSSQWPNNRQIHYIGGTQLIDYFSSASWLDNLLYHETAHNYQTNIKASPVSRTLHSIFGNGSVVFPIPMNVPNVMESSFMLEGNAVLNESWHGNGGRLYSGRFKAETILQAKAGKITAAEVYNAKLAFPYGDIAYIQGAFYNLYMAEKYGIEALNSYFFIHSEDFFWPQFTNASMLAAVGVDFESSLLEFSKVYAKMGESFKEARGEKITGSQFFYPLSNDKDEIFFIINKSGVQDPELIVLSKKDKSLKKVTQSWLPGKVIKKDSEYYTQASAYISPSKIVQGLFCKQGFIKDDTASKMVQGYLSSGEAVYFDVPSSFSEAQLYVGGQFYAKVNSSVIIDARDNLYYFVQNKKRRTLYRNKTPLYSYEGFYGIPADVDTLGGIYFVANSELGTTLYKYEDAKVYRVSEADNVIEARLLEGNGVFIAAIGDKEYYYVKTKLIHRDETPYETKLFFEEKEYYARDTRADILRADSFVDLSQPYSSVSNLHYSGTDLFLASSNTNTYATLNMNFSDPLSQNAATAFISKDASQIGFGGLEYANSQYLLQYRLAAYGVFDNNDREDIRDLGIIAGVNLPYYRAGYYLGNLELNYFQDYETDLREPLSAVVSFSRREHYGLSMYENYLNFLKIYASTDKGDFIYGGQYRYKKSFEEEIYLGADFKYSDLSARGSRQNSGVKISNIAYQQDMDPTTIHMPSLDASYYVKSAGYGEISVAKVLNFSSYWFTFPLSLQRESLYTKYRYYELQTLGAKRLNFSEITAGITLSNVFLNKYSFPLNLEYIYNDADFIQNENNVRLTFGISF
ncbi:hypothetical protein KJ877_09240 [bacterium]|nr:hypothetical protein [bacterium]MBU1989448.1 hypothetical protein [bacterium]